MLTAVGMALGSALALSPIGSVTVGADPACDTPWGSLPKVDQPFHIAGQLENIRAGRHDCYDRLVIDVDGDGPASYDIRYVDQLGSLGSGFPIELRGGAALRILVDSPAHDEQGQPTYAPPDPDDVVDVTGWDTFRQVLFDGSYEGQSQIGLGVRARLPMRAFTLDQPGPGWRLVIDVAHRWPPEPIEPDLPGEPATAPFELGTPLAVIGVTADDVLNVRELPGPGEPIVLELDPLATGLFYAGQARLIGTRIWYEIDVGNFAGWVSSRHAAPLAGTFDVTSEVVTDLGGIPTGRSVTEIGDQVVASRIGGSDPRPDVVVSDGPVAGDLHEITYDVIGFFDDSVRGERLHVFAAPAEDGSDLMSLKSVEATYICQRGGGGEQGLCP
jgi:hypothetical protein